MESNLIKRPPNMHSPLSRRAGPSRRAGGIYAKPKAPEANRDLKNAIWAYFLLIIFEGALRKWFIPGLATPLLVIRDPIVLWALIKAGQRKLLPANGYTAVMYIVTIIGFVLAILIGHGNMAVAIFGARITLLHFPFMFVIGNVLTRKDIIKIGRVTLLIAVPMTLLIGLQFYSPQTAWVNRGIGGAVVDGFTGAKGFSRPSGTFSFTSGTSIFYGLVACYVFYFFVEPGEIKKYLLWAGMGALMIALPLSISRTLFSEILLSLLFAVIVMVRKPKHLGKVVGSLVIGALILLVLSRFQFFLTALDALSTRFEQASEGEGTNAAQAFVDRLFGGLGSAVVNSSKLPLFGLGLGMGTNVGAILLTGEKIFLISEGEWGRVIGEQGLLMGAIIILTRVGLSLKLAVASYRRMVLDEVLPWLLLSNTFMNLSLAEFGQPTSLGFSTLMGGLLIAALKTSPVNGKTIRFKI